MGSLQDLERYENSIHLLYTNSSLVSIYVHDTLKRVYNCNRDSMYTVETKSDFSEMLELVNVQPYEADKWVFEIDWKKCKNWLKKNKWVFETDSSCFCIIVKSYKEFKDVKELVNKCNDLYLSVIRKWDTYYLLRDFELSEKIKQFVAVSYSKDVEKVFEFAKQLQSGITVNTTKDVVRLLGATSSSVSHYAMTLLNDPPTTKKGLKRVYLNRVQTGIELCNAYGCSQFKNFLTATVFDFLQIKTLYMEGIIYDKIDDLPTAYDKVKLSRHNMYLSRITTEIPYDRILNLYCYLKDKENRMWSSTSDLLMFLYSYYGGIEDGVIG